MLMMLALRPWKSQVMAWKGPADAHDAGLEASLECDCPCEVLREIGC